MPVRPHLFAQIFNPRRAGFVRARPLTFVVLLALAISNITSTSAAQTLTVLYTFTGGSDGATPTGVIRDSAGNLYGTTVYGGGVKCSNPLGCGTVFKVDSAGKETVLHSFGTAGDGKFPAAPVIRDRAGNLYGATENGGITFCNDGCGTVFKLNSSGKELAVHKFSGRLGGASPGAGVIRDSSGNLIGTTVFGGAFGFGAVYKLDNNGKETVLYSFTGEADGAYPNGMIRDAAGNFYGTTSRGGDLNGCGFASGCGVVFKLDSTGKETVLYTFTETTDGGQPFWGVTRDAAGNLYGVTDAGVGKTLFGSAFKIDSAGKFSVLYSFSGDEGGEYPSSPLILDAAGNLYGTTSNGGNELGGTVFKIDTAGKLTALYSFDYGQNGGDPNGLVLDAAGNLYGTTGLGGDPACACGVVFKLVP